MRPVEWTRSAWAADVAATAFCIVLLIRGHATVHSGLAAQLLVVTAFTVTALASVAAAAARAETIRLMPLLAALMTTGLTRSDSALVIVAAFAAAALFPVAALWSAGKTSQWLAATLVSVSVGTAAVRLLYRDPFRELSCAPACVTNPWLRVHSPDLVRNVESALATVTLIWAVAAAISLARLRRAVDAATVSVVAVIVLASVWAVHLVQQPRPGLGDTVDRGLALALLGAIALASSLRSVAPLQKLAMRRRVHLFATSLSNASDKEAIAAHLRRVTRDPTITIELGDSTSGGPSVTSIRRSQHTVAAIHHDPAARGRVAAAVTPATALALETQMMLQQAGEQLAHLKTSRTAAVLAADGARRRLERDLHDGAQQRLLVVGMQLANASCGPTDNSLNTAAAHVAAALSDLRRLGRGDAAVVAELGLDNAITAVTGTAPVPTRVTSTRCDDATHDCWPQDVATTAYRVVRGALIAAQRSGALEISVELRCRGAGNGRKVATAHDGQIPEDRSADHDRVLAAGGRITTDDGRAFEAWLP